MGIKRKLAAALVGAAVVVAVPTAAQAEDHGDGKTACNSGEICFQFSWDGFSTSTFQRHFWYSDSNHNDDVFGNVPNGNTSLLLADNAHGFWNRDTSCSVTLYVSTSYRNGYATIARGGKQSISNWNQSHKRCA
ncbi:hypothetical protein ODJ79_11370 [Actinoplanes sp. KI2]|uniref:hypothetical protein n=1 Tax=Actinoplanes sp. KI2 TaxID=2983315 RepID=UPI0021D5EBD5|nr:hypothetical protein [Actinoplanes sp. KI2]MCU7724316.1 hypothetical protein [Actinoplanes sp. KI2]